MVFDAAGFYGHNECDKPEKATSQIFEGQTDMRHAVDVKAVRINRYKFGRDYMKEYHSHFPISAPEDDLAARLALYSLRR